MTHPLKQQADVLQGIAPAEVFPTKAGEISALASAGAPFVAFDSVFAYTMREGQSTISLSCDRPIRLTGDGGVVCDKVLTGHLRATPPVLRQLRDTIDLILAMTGDPSAAARINEHAQHHEPVDLAAAPSPSDAKN